MPPSSSGVLIYAPLAGNLTGSRSHGKDPETLADVMQDNRRRGDLLREQYELFLSCLCGSEQWCAGAGGFAFFLSCLCGSEQRPNRLAP